MHLSRRQTRSILKAVIPLLALVWAALPLHPCNLAVAAAGDATALHGAAADAASDTASTAQHCHQHPADDQPQPAQPGVHCGDLGRAAPDQRPPVLVDAVLAHVTWDASWLDRGLDPVSLTGIPRPFDAGHWRFRPLHLQKAVLLI